MTEGAFEARKISYRQTKDGMVIAFAIHPNDVPLSLMNAPIGTIYAIGFREMPEGDQSAAPSADAGTGNALPGQTDLVASSALTEAVAVSAPKQRRHFSELPRSQQAGMLCNDPRFQKWMGVSTSEEAALRVRIHCQVNSRSWLDDYLHYPEAAGKWDGLAIVFHAENSLMAEMR